MQIMLSIDQNYYWLETGDSHKLFSAWSLYCRVRVFTPHPELTTIVLTSQQPSHQNTLRDALPHLAPLILQDYRINPASAVWIEHYPKELGSLLENSEQFWQAHLIWQGQRVVEAFWVPLREGQVSSMVGHALG